MNQFIKQQGFKTDSYFKIINTLENAISEIEAVDKIKDEYIQDAIIHALSSCEMNARIEVFFREILKDKELLEDKVEMITFL